jgi:hypothetical protein
MPTNPLLRRATMAPPAPDNPYAHLGLLRNPFPEKPGVIPGGEDPRSNGSIYVESIRRQEQQRFEELLIPKANRQSLPMAFLMDTGTRHGRGIGKTAFLNHQRLRVMRDLGGTVTDGAHVLFAAHVFTPSGGSCRKFWQFARLLIHTLNEQEVFAQLFWRLRAFSERIPEEILAEATDLRVTIGDDQWLVRKGVDVEGELTPTVETALTQAGVGHEFAHALAASGHSPERFRHDFLRHQSDYRWRQQAGPLLVEDLVSAFRVGGFTRGLFLVDDFEKAVLAQNSLERRTFVDDLRYSFLDGPTTAARTGFYSFLWVIYPLIQEVLINHWNAAGMERFCAIGGQRAAAYTIDFTPLTLEASELLVRAYLDAARIPGEGGDPLRPFDHEALEEAFRITKGLPGHLLAWLNQVVERATRDNWPTIDVARVRDLAGRQPPFPQDEAPAPPLAPPGVDLLGGEG